MAGRAGCPLGGVRRQECRSTRGPPGVREGILTMTPQPEEILPQSALARLRGGRGPGERTLFTSDLSVNEFVLVQEMGFEPLGLVMGSSIFPIRIQLQRWGQSTESAG